VRPVSAAVVPVPSCDFDALSPDLRFRSRGRTITEADIVAFSALTGDWHPQHADAEWAAESRFGERIAHGMLVLSCALGLIQLDPERVVAMRRVSRVTFRNPVRIGDTIRVEGAIAGLKPIDERIGLVEIACRVLVGGSMTAVGFTAEVMWGRGPCAPGEGSVDR